jgi:hypothetical protein
MAKKVKTSLDFEKNEIQNVVVQKLASAPASPVSGQIYYNTTLNAFHYYNGTAWVKCVETPAAANVGTGTAVYKGLNGNTLEFRKILAGDGSILVALVGDDITIKVEPSGIEHNDLGGIGTNDHAAIDSHIEDTENPHSTNKTQVGLGNVDNVQQLPMSYLDTDTTLAAIDDARVPSQRAVRTYVDNKVTGVTWKNSVRAATTANITLSGTQTIDGVAVVAGDRVLVKNQTTASANGIYVVNAGAWSRAADNDTAAEMVNATVMVQEGTTQAETQWTCSTNAPITLNTTALTFVQMSGAGTYGAGTGLSLSGNTFSIDSTVVTKTGVQALTNKTIDADNNTVSNLETDNFKAGVIDTDTALAADSDVKIATQRAIKGFVNTQIGTRTKYYKGTITAASTGTITGATHSCGTSPIVQVYEVSGGNAYLVEVDVAIATASGDITWTAGATFTGYIVIIGK